MRGPLDEVSLILQQLAWLTAVFRRPVKNALMVSTAALCKTGRKVNIVPKTTDLSTLVPATVPGEAISTYWHRLFYGTVLAYGFSISKRDRGDGC